MGGVCSTDKFTVPRVGYPPLPTLCGNNTGNSIFIYRCFYDDHKNRRNLIYFSFPRSSFSSQRLYQEMVIFKGTVWPDQISPRVVLLDRPRLGYSLKLLISLFNFFNGDNNQIYLHDYQWPWRTAGMRSFVFLLSGGNKYAEKIRQSVLLAKA